MIRDWQKTIEDYFNDQNQFNKHTNELLINREVDRINYNNHITILQSKVLEENHRYLIVVQNDSQINYDQKGKSFEEEKREAFQLLINKQNKRWIIDKIKPLNINTQESLFKEHPKRKIEEEPDVANQSNITASVYNRQKAVDYANRWWNSHNPRFRAFEVDCTNYISQCLWAGGAPMSFSNSRANGWWYRGSGSRSDSWSYSWAVAHNLRWHLHTSKSGLTATEVDSPDKLSLGDVICYDFDGDGKWQHNTIVTAKDALGMPLVNAHTVNSKQRYWSYRDSYAWTDKIQYKFYHIHDQF